MTPRLRTDGAAVHRAVAAFSDLPQVPQFCEPKSKIRVHQAETKGFPGFDEPASALLLEGMRASALRRERGKGGMIQACSDSHSCLAISFCESWLVINAPPKEVARLVPPRVARCIRASKHRLCEKLVVRWLLSHFALC